MLEPIERRIRLLRSRFSRSSWIINILSLSRHLPTDLPSNPQRLGYQKGLVLLQIDGLSNGELEKALKNNRMPFLDKLLKQQRYRRMPMYSGLPSSTPGVQGELFYGRKTAVPSFAFFNRETKQIDRMWFPECAGRVQKELERHQTGLLSGGSAYCNIYTGGATETHFCASSMSWTEVLNSIKPIRWLVVILFHLPFVLRSLILAIAEIFLAIVDVIRGQISGYSLVPELKFIIARAGVSILLRDLCTFSAKTDMQRGLPIIHLNLLGYDEQAHRRGPQSKFAHWTLKGIDSSIKTLWKSAQLTSCRQYDLWIYSDHGQESTIPIQRLINCSIEDAVKQAVEKCRLISSTISIDKNEVYAVVAQGPVGHIYFARNISKQDLETIVSILVKDFSVPACIYSPDGGKLLAHSRNGNYKIPEEITGVIGESHPYCDEIEQDLMRLCQHKNAGDIVLLGWANNKIAVSFAQENGGHAGIGPNETDAFVVIPEDSLTDPEITSLRPDQLRQLALTHNNILTSSVQNQANLSSTKTLRVLSYNIHSCIGMDGVVAPQRIARVISNLKPDIVCLQEVDMHRVRTHTQNQAAIIAEMLDMEYVFVGSITGKTEKYGNAVLSKFPITATKDSILPNPYPEKKNEPRSAQWVSIEWQSITVNLINTHLGLHSKERMVHANVLASEEWLGDKRFSDHGIFCGDLNSVSRSNVVKTLCNHLSNTHSTTKGLKNNNTFASRTPLARIDHILIGSDWSVVNHDVPNDELTKVASDHLPVLVELKIKSSSRD